MSVLGLSTYRLLLFFWTAMDRLYPPRWGGCRAEGVRRCQDCQKKVEIIKPLIYDRCGKLQHTHGLSRACVSKPPPCRALRSWEPFSGSVRNILQHLKYPHDLGMGEILYREFIHTLKETGRVISLIVPVSLGVVRLRERGYNQAHM